MRKEAERGKEIEYCVEPLRPPSRHFSHVAASVSKRRAGAALSRLREQLSGVIEAVDIVARLGQQMCVPALATWHVENARADWQSKQLDEARCLLAVALWCE